MKKIRRILEQVKGTKFATKCVSVVAAIAMLGGVAGVGTALASEPTADAAALATPSATATTTSAAAGSGAEGASAGGDAGAGDAAGAANGTASTGTGTTTPSESASASPSTTASSNTGTTGSAGEAGDSSATPDTDKNVTSTPVPSAAASTSVETAQSDAEVSRAAIPTPAAAPAARAESGDSNVTVNLFDYYEASSADYQNGNGKLDVNSATCGAFWFNGNPPNQYSCGGNRNSNPGVSGENFWTSGIDPTQGLVESILNEDGYPTLSRRITDNYNGYGSMPNSNMKFLFSDESLYAKAYSNVSGLFNVNNGHYSYDSTQQFAQLKGNATDGWSFEHKTAIKDQGSSEAAKFLPFNAVDNNGNLTSSGAVAPAPNGAANLSFGMTVETTFLQPKDGLIVTGKNEDGTDKTENMKFSFNGDDDVWVFIDGKLVLDIGGIHGARGGSIDFATGAVHVDGHSDTTLASLMGFAEGKTTFDDYSTHTLKFFYLERGGGASNCQLNFNLQTIPEGTISVGKRITESNTASFSDASFTMSVQTSTTKESGYSSYTGKYYVCPLNGVCTRPDDSKLKQIAADGKFTLKNNERAVLVGDENHPIDASTYYKVTEYTADNYDQEDYQFTLDGVKDEKGGQIGDIDLGNASPAVRVDDHRLVVVNNKFLKKNKYTFQVTKQMAAGSDAAGNQQFAMKVTNGDGVAYVGNYYLVDENGGQASTASHTDNGIISLKAGQAAKIVDVAAGTTFKVAEDTSELAGYESPVYADNEASDANSGESEQTVTVGKDNASGEITVTNVKLTPANRKYIVKDAVNGDNVVEPKDSYTLNLDVTGKSANASSTVGTNTPVDVVLVVDNSKSMSACIGDDTPSVGDRPACADEASSRWSKVKDAAKSLMGSLQESQDSKALDVRVGLMTFSRGYDVKKFDGEKVFSSEPSEAAEVIKSLTMTDQGGTNWYLGLKKAKDTYDGFVRGNAKKYVVFLTDGQPTRAGDNQNGSDLGYSIKDYDKHHGDKDEGSWQWQADTNAQAVELVKAGWNVLNVGVDLFEGPVTDPEHPDDRYKDADPERYFNALVEAERDAVGDTKVTVDSYLAGQNISSVFDKIGQTIASTTSFSIGGVTITDVLTDKAEPYTGVDANGEPQVWKSDGDNANKTLSVGTLGDKNVDIEITATKKESDKTVSLPDDQYFKDGKAKADAGFTATYDASARKIEVKFPDGYTLADGYTYTVKFKVRPTDSAYDAYASGKRSDQKGYTDQGGENTGSTSVDKSGFFTNEDGAKVSYCVAKSVNGAAATCPDGLSKSSNYKKPVLQVKTGQIKVTKNWSPETSAPTAKDAKVTVKLYKGAQSSETNLVESKDITKSADSKWEATFDDLAPGTYTVTEAPVDGYDPSYAVDGNSGSTVEITRDDLWDAQSDTALSDNVETYDVTVTNTRKTVTAKFRVQALVGGQTWAMQQSETLFNYKLERVTNSRDADYSTANVKWYSSNGEGSKRLENSNTWNDAWLTFDVPTKQEMAAGQNVYTFYITESGPSTAVDWKDSNGDLKRSSARYQVIVTATSSGASVSMKLLQDDDGTQVASDASDHIVNGVPTAVFDHKFCATPQVTKSVEGRNSNQDFKFKLTETQNYGLGNVVLGNTEATVTGSKGEIKDNGDPVAPSTGNGFGTILFLPGTYTFTVTEEDPGAGWANVTDGKDKTAIHEITYEAGLHAVSENGVTRYVYTVEANDSSADTAGGASDGVVHFTNKWIAVSSLPLTGASTGRQWLVAGGVIGGLALLLAGAAGVWRSGRRLV